jgi:hypothetical protein
MIDPSTVRLSKHFLLSDFMSNHSVQTRGYRNLFPEPRDSGYGIRIANGIALCENALEPILAQHGPLSISYGYISPELSREIVHYQDPDKPSHHRWDLGAAADICVHSWVNGDPDDDTLTTAPIALAHQLDGEGIPYSRLISYSESPYLCLAVSAKELANARPRKAFYENRFAGQSKTKPSYFSRSTEAARARSLADLQAGALTHGWRGAGYPTYHGGGRRQAQHIRISKYTMLCDWLIDLQSIATGAKNIPNLSDQRLVDTFYAVGDAYDDIIDLCKVPRMSIIAGYVSPASPYFTRANDWRSGKATFSLVPPEGLTADDVRMEMLFQRNDKITGFGSDPNILDITVEL